MSGSRPSDTSASRRRRGSILDAARALIAERGIDKLVIADVAERADVSVATIYNLVGTRDRLLIALLDDVAETVRAQLDSGPVSIGIDGCIEVITAACETVISDAVTVRTVLASVGAVAPDQWLTEGMEGAIRQRVNAAFELGRLSGFMSPAAVANGIHLGFRGALISWVFGLLSDRDLRPNAELMALHVLANAAALDHRVEVESRLHALAAATTSSAAPSPHIELSNPKDAS